MQYLCIHDSAEWPLSRPLHSEVNVYSNVSAADRPFVQLSFPVSYHHLLPGTRGAIQYPSNTATKPSPTLMLRNELQYRTTILTIC